MKKIGSEMAIDSVWVESQCNPLGIDIRKPRLSWKLRSDRKGVTQSAYRLVVSRVLQGSKEEIWDSGKVTSDQSVYIEYAGPDLESRLRYEWKVKAWDERNMESDWSKTGYWEMGLLHLDDWTARWIEPEQMDVTEESKLNMDNVEWDNLKDVRDPADRLHPCPILRRSFEVRDGVARARVYATAHGIYTLEINGRRVGDREFAPEFTAYDQYLQYQTYDVTELLQVGEQVLGTTLADGWYAGRNDIIGDSCHYGNRLGLLLQLEIDYTDGTRQTVISDSQFRSSFGQLRYADLFIGEKVDARLAQHGWNLPEFDDNDWSAVQEADYTLEDLIADYGEPVRAVETVAAIQVMTTPMIETVVDFGQVIAGRVRMKVQGEAGTVIRLEHSEVLDENGNYINNIKGRNKDQTDIYILHGGSEEIYEPKFTFHGFRYVKVTGYPGIMKTDDITAVVLSSDLRKSGTFQCSDERINRLQENIVWSQKANFLSIPTDCPQRERAGWTGDIQIYAPTACYNTDTNAFLTRWLRNVVVEQLPDGQIPNVVPYSKGYREIAAHIGHSSAGWGDAIVIVPWALYQAYGDRRVLEENYDAMVKWVAYIEKTAAEQLPHELKGMELDINVRERQKYLWNTGFHFGDWLIPSLSMSPDGSQVDLSQSAMLTKDLVPSCFYAYSTDIISRIASELGHKGESERYAELNVKIRSSFAEEYLEEDGKLKNHFQGIYVLALQMNMIPNAMRSKVLDQLVGLIEENGNRLDTGFVSSPFLLDVLCTNGRADVAYRLLYQTDCPSWLYEVEQGATTIWESWQAILPSGKVTNVSYNHYAFGCVGDWLYRHIAGIDKSEAGYKHITLKPDLKCGLEYAKAEYDSVYGLILSEWSKREGQWQVSVEIPVNTTASLYLMNANRNSLQMQEGIATIHEIDGYIQVELGSGKYEFQYSI